MSLTLMMYSMKLFFYDLFLFHSKKLKGIILIEFSFFNVKDCYKIKNQRFFRLNFIKFVPFPYKVCFVFYVFFEISIFLNYT